MIYDLFVTLHKCSTDHMKQILSMHKIWLADHMESFCEDDDNPLALWNHHISLLWDMLTAVVPLPNYFFILKKMIKYVLELINLVILLKCLKDRHLLKSSPKFDQFAKNRRKISF